MNNLNRITLFLVILGALNWGLMGLFQLDVVATLFAGPQSTLSRIIYIAIGLSGLYQTIPLINALTGDAENADGATSSALRYDHTAAQRDRGR